jgi:hypothetical protein
LEKSASGFVTPSFQTAKPVSTSWGHTGALEHKIYHETGRLMYKPYIIKKDMHINRRAYQQPKYKY